MEDYKVNFEKLIQRIYDLTVNGCIDEKVGKAILKDFTVESDDERIRKALIQHIKDKVSVILGWRKEELIAWLEKIGEPQDKGEISDGYHTFNELYYYRMLYNAAFFNILPKEWVHKSKKHHDGEECFGGG